MTSALLAPSDEIEIPAPLPHQERIVASSARFKVCRAGRRGGKTVLAEGCAIVGHGPEGEDGEPIFKGIVHDLDVVWVARDYTQAGIMWHEFIRPRFKGKDGVRVNEQDRTVSLSGAGTLFVISAENIASARGMGKRLAGVIVEEAAWLDLQAALRDVLLPALMDNEGWLLLISTTNAGPDGGKDEADQPRVPSYFNVICEEIRAGERDGTVWQEFHFTAENNPKITRRAFDALVAEYPDESPSLKQEVFAELLTAGIGLALEQVCEEQHIVPRFKIPSHWTQFGAMDWGFNHPYAFGWFAVDEDGSVVLVDTIWGRKEQPDRIGQKVGAAVPIPSLQYIVGGHDLWADIKARGEDGPTLAERFTTVFKWPLIKASISRVTGLNNLRYYVQWRGEPARDGQPATPDVTPRFRMMDTDGNRRLLKCLQAMQVDPKHIEDAQKVDADAAGNGGDDGYDMARYGLMSRPLVTVGLTVRRRGENIDQTRIEGGRAVLNPKQDTTWQRFDRQQQARQLELAQGASARQFKAPRRGQVRTVST